MLFSFLSFAGMAHQQLTYLHRQFIARLLAEGRTRSFIAEVLEVHRSTIGRELKRNCLSGKPYCPHTAQLLADVRNGIHAHKGPKFSLLRKPYRFRDRKRELSLRARNRPQPWRAEKRKAWQRFCFCWKRPRPSLKKESFRLRLWKKEGIRFRFRNQFVRYRWRWSFRFQRYPFRYKKSRPAAIPEYFPFHLPDPVKAPEIPPPSEVLSEEVAEIPVIFAVGILLPFTILLKSAQGGAFSAINARDKDFCSAIFFFSARAAVISI